MKYIFYSFLILFACQGEEHRNIPEPTPEQYQVIQKQLDSEKQNSQSSYSSSVPIHNNSNAFDNNTYYEDQSIEDGDHEAEVEYFNPNTGTRSTYTLTVEIENGEVVKIYWPNGGWLDESHFSATELDEKGNASFTSDRGYEYNITVTDLDSYQRNDSNNYGDTEDSEDESEDDQ